MTSSALYEKSKSLGSGGSMVSNQLLIVDLCYLCNSLKICKGVYHTQFMNQICKISHSKLLLFLSLSFTGRKAET